MPVRRVEVDGQPAYRWGDRGRAYTFDPERPGSEERARASAEEQGRVIEERIAAAMSRTFKPPAEVRDAAQAALVLRASLPPSRRAMTAVGLARARDLANGRSVSMETLLRMRDYFRRHAVDKEGEGWGVDSKGWQAWLGWGGDAGQAWADKIVAEYLEA
jgi:hypothetical protein